MPPGFIENPILNSPFREPTCHFRFDAIEEKKEERNYKELDVVPVECREKAKAGGLTKRVQTAKTMWIPAVNNLGTFGRWAFLEVDGSNLHKTKQVIRKLLRGGA